MRFSNTELMDMAIAAGEKTPSHRPPSEAKHFCGEK